MNNEEPKQPAESDLRPIEPNSISIARVTVKKDGTVEYEGDAAAIADAIEAHVRARARGERKRKMWGGDTFASGEAMTRLAQMFPCLQGKPNTNPWTEEGIDELLRWLPVASHGEQVCARFLLSVWNTGTDWAKVAREKRIKGYKAARRFDLFEAMNVLSNEELRAILAWIECPFFP